MQRNTIQLFDSEINSSENENIDSIITTQKRIRGLLARKKFRIERMQKPESYLTFVIGNDPIMPAELGNYSEPDKKIALIATSGMRAVSIACELGNSKHIPKIFIIDNSSDVYQFWRTMQLFAADDLQSGREDLFKKNLPEFLFKNKSLFRYFSPNQFEIHCTKDVKYPNQDILAYFNELFNSYGFDYVRNIILHASVFEQSWADNLVFEKLKNILNYLEIEKIYMYASNIVSCIQNPDDKLQVLKNIESLSPVMSIHTNKCRKHKLSENVILATHQSATSLHMMFFKPNACSGVDKESELRNLFREAEKGDSHIVRELLLAGADPNLLYETATPLFIACQNGHHETVDLLLEHEKTDISLAFTTTAGELRESAEEEGIEKEIEEFLSAKNITDNEQVVAITPAEIADIMGHRHIVEKINARLSSSSLTY
jgi:Ankyrin repeats (3 copies)/IQ calmodulin-binding motif